MSDIFPLQIEPKPNVSLIQLDRGQYLAPETCSYEYGAFFFGLTHYPEALKTGKWHSHHRPMISSVLTGSNVESREGRTFTRQAGSTDCYRADEVHANHYVQFPAKHLSLEIESQFLHQHGFDENAIEKAIRRNEHAQLALIAMLLEARVGDAHSLETLTMMVLDFLDNSLACTGNGPLPQWVKEVRAFLQDNWDRSVTLDELTQVTGLHPCTISKNFNRYFHCNLGTYMRKLKIGNALKLLLNKQYSTTEIACICGFSDHSHFTRTFKSLTGFLPKTFRTI